MDKAVNNKNVDQNPYSLRSHRNITNPYSRTPKYNKKCCGVTTVQDNWYEIVSFIVSLSGLARYDQG